MATKIEFTRVNNDTYGNPRYVCHFLDLITEKDREGIPDYDISQLYAVAIRKAKKIHGHKFHNKQYGGGIVFQSYNIEELENQINKIKL